MAGVSDYAPSAHDFAPFPPLGYAVLVQTPPILFYSGGGTHSLRSLFTGGPTRRP
jgi:hypothetical protein